MANNISLRSPQSAKSLLLNQANRCRERLQLLGELQENVYNAVDEAVNEISDVVVRVREAAETADQPRMKLLAKEIRTASNLIRQYEVALEKVLDISEQEPDNDSQTLNSSVDFERRSAVRHGTPVSPEPLQSAAIAENQEADLLQFSDGDRSATTPDFQTAESCSVSSFNDSSCNERTRAASLTSLLTGGNTSSQPASSLVASNSLQTMPIVRIPPGQIRATVMSASAAIQTQATVVRVAPIPNPQVQMGQDVELASNIVTAVESSASSQTEVLSSSDSATSSEQESYFSFVDGDRVPAGQFHCSIDRAVRFYVRHIVTPDEFYVQTVSHELSTSFNQMRTDIKIFYEYEDQRKPLFADGCSPRPDGKVGLYCVYRLRDHYTESYEIERCVILAWREALGAARATGFQRYEAQVRFLDLGRTQWVSAAQLWKIERRFCQIPALAIHCRLFDTRPRDEGTETAFGVWSEDAIVKFKSLCDGDKPMTGFIFCGRKEPYGLMIYAYQGTDRKCINLEMVLSKMAKTMTNWNRAANTPSDDQEQPENLHGVDSNWNVDFLCFGAEIRPLQSPAVNAAVFVDVVKLFSCCRFSVNFPDGVGDVNLMERDPQYAAISQEPIRRYELAMQEMNEYYASDIAGGFSRWPMVGQLVASKYTDDERFYRARIIEVIPQESLAHVRYVDYGNEAWTNIQALRPLHPRFLAYPYMALECRLHGLHPLPASIVGGNKNTLWELINRRKLLAQIVEVHQRTPPAGPILSVNLWTTDGQLNFNDFVADHNWAERA